MKTQTFKATRVWPDSTWHTDMPFPVEVVVAGKLRGEHKHRGLWHTLTEYHAIAMEQTEDNIDTSHYEPFNTTAIIHGIRSLQNPRQSGYELEGTVSINGKRRRAFTSSAMFSVNGKLVDVAILYVCRGKNES